MRFTFNSLYTCCFSAQPGMHPKLGPKPAHQQTEINPPMSQKEHIEKKRAEERKQQELEELHVSVSGLFSDHSWPFLHIWECYKV